MKRGDEWAGPRVTGGAAGPGVQLEVAAWSCSCPLSDDESGELGAQAAEALDGFDSPSAPPEREIRRVVEDDPA